MKPKELNIKIHRQKAAAGKVLVRCLGPGPEHTFPSPDPVRIRVCPRCANLRHALRDAEVPIHYDG